MKKVLLFGLIFSSLLAFGQTEEDDYDTEITWGVNKNTNSGLIGGVIFKLARRKQNETFVTYGVELMNVKHPKERHYLSPTSGTRFIWGKESYLYAIRGLYGREQLLFRKAPQQGVQISAVAAAGPTIGIVAPYYILYQGNYVQFDPEKHRSFNAIQGSGKLFQGLGESRFVPGANAKAGLTFEFGAFKNNVAGVEVGASLEAYPKKIIIIPTQENRAVFTALYFSIFWGTRR